MFDSCPIDPNDHRRGVEKKQVVGPFIILIHLKCMYILYTVKCVIQSVLAILRPFPETDKMWISTIVLTLDKFVLLFFPYMTTR